MCDEHEEDIVDALRQDLSKPQLESIVYEVWEIPGITFFFFWKFSLVFFFCYIWYSQTWCDVIFYLFLCVSNCFINGTIDDAESVTIYPSNLLLNFS
jgi:hypothetical protein